MSDTSQLDPLPFLKGFVSLRGLAGMYPAGHPMVVQKLQELDSSLQRHLRVHQTLQMDIIHGVVHLNGVSFRHDSDANAPIISELTDAGISSVHMSPGVTSDELHAVACLLWNLENRAPGASIASELAQRHVSHITLGRIVPLDTRWRAQQWPEAPTGPLDPAYAESLLMAQHAFEHAASGRQLTPVTVNDLVQILICRVARSSAALGQILAIKQYENLTYCHSVNVAMLSLLLARRLGFAELTIARVVEAAVLHDIGKTRVPLGLVKKPGALDKRERKLIEAHTLFGSELLTEIEGLSPLTATAALEHHRTVAGGGYPDLGEGKVPNILSQMISVADVYEALTGARTYQEPKQPEQACLVLARLAGATLNTALVKAFVNVVTFFPLGCLVRTDNDELGVVIRTNPNDPLHPVLALADQDLAGPRGELDTSVRDASGTYKHHIVETLKPPADGGWDLMKFLPAAAAE